EKNRHYEKLRKNGFHQDARAQLEKGQYDVYSLWYALPVREMLALPDFREDPEWIAARIFPPIRPAEAKKALELLKRVGLARRGEDGRLRPAETNLITPPNVQSLAVRNYHRAMLEKAAASLDGLPQETRNVTSLTFTLRKDQYEELCKRIWEFEREVIEKNTEEPGGSSEVFVLGVQLFPLTRKKEES
ncbi:MAG: DUF4423 domain-containing protein, partial [Bdellovibrionota bacterium]